MTDASSSPEDQSHQAKVRMAHSSIQPSETFGIAEEELKSAFAQMGSLVSMYRKGIPIRCDQYSDLCDAYYKARRRAIYNRICAGMEYTNTINIDSATAYELSHIRTMVGQENDAMHDCYKMIALTRSDLTALEKIKQVCVRVLQEVDGTPEGTAMETEARKIASEASGRQKRVVAQLRYFM